MKKLIFLSSAIITSIIKSIKKLLYVLTIVPIRFLISSSYREEVKRIRDAIERRY